MHDLHLWRLLRSPEPDPAEAARAYNEIAARQGVTLKLGARQNLCRFPHIAPSAAEFDRRLRDYDVALDL